MGCNRSIAIYGKGGIGKSTIAVNTAVLMAKSGLKVALVGCDPKQDTVRLLTGEIIPSILECYEELNQGEMELNECVRTGAHGILCAEVGGPKPGVGCAGRGIIMALDFLKKRRCLDGQDVIIYDVLGDVVCGGFAAPVVRGYASDIYIVSSGEQASLFAACNILRGMGEIGCPVKGLIINCAGFEGEAEAAASFAKLVKLPQAALLPHDKGIPESELKGMPAVDGGISPETMEAYQVLRTYMMNPPENTAGGLAPGRKEFYAWMGWIYKG